LQELRFSTPLLVLERSLERGFADTEVAARPRTRARRAWSFIAVGKYVTLGIERCVSVAGDNFSRGCYAVTGRIEDLDSRNMHPEIRSLVRPCKGPSPFI
jgi:hypothetical protein